MSAAEISTAISGLAVFAQGIEPTTLSAIWLEGSILGAHK